MDRKIRRGEIYIADLDPVIGSEQGGERPVLVIQNNVGNTHSPTVIVLAITSRCQKKKYMPTHIPIESSDLSMSSIALAEQVRTVDKTRLTRYVGRASKESMEAVDQALKVSMGVS
ncbi:MAG: type II toxin-antitoxin system PemK/MazF family toxin [Clostridia bacterium]|jgi:mRNA interferase MazF|nr:type II toxin-antitoxin system PemK/MazF family toxin [Clostridia bacterium]